MANARMRAVADPDPEEPEPVDAAPEPEPEITEAEVLEEPAPAGGTADQLLRSIYAVADQARIHAAQTREEVTTIRKTVAGGVLVLLALMFLISIGRKAAPAS